jgi:hypothetical protein
MAFGTIFAADPISDPDNLVEKATITASSSLSVELGELPGSDHWAAIEHSVAQMLPISGKMPAMTVCVEASQHTT